MSVWEDIEKERIEGVLNALKSIVKCRKENPDDFIRSYLVDAIKSIEYSLEAIEKGADGS